MISDKDSQKIDDAFDKITNETEPIDSKKTAGIKRLVRNRLPKIEAEDVSIQKWRKAIKSNFPELLMPAEASASVIAQLLINDITNPFALVLIDVPSSGKTITLNFFSEIEEIAYFVDNFSAASFVSQAANVKKKDLGEVDLLPKINGKTLIVRDLAPLFGSDDKELLKTMGLMTRIFDGEGLRLHGGVHGGRGYDGDCVFMFLGASTPFMPRVWKTMGNFGSRLFFLGINSAEKDEKTLADQLKINSVREKEKVIRAVTKGFIYSILSKYPNGVEWKRTKDDNAVLENVAKRAKLLAKLRGTVSAWKETASDSELTHSVPIIEMPDRINQLLYNFARGHAVLCSRDYLVKEDVDFISNIILDSAPYSRIKPFKYLLQNDGSLTTSETMEKLKYSRTSALKVMEELKMLDLVYVEDAESNELGRPEKKMKLKKEFEWLLKKNLGDLHNDGATPDSLLPGSGEINV